MKKFHKICLLLLLFALFAGCATQRAVTVAPIDLNGKITSGQLVQKVNAFEVLFDATMSMNDALRGGTKLQQEKDLLSLFERTIPDLRLVAAERVFGEFTMFDAPTSKVIYGPSDYTKLALTSASVRLEGNGMSPLDGAFDGATQDLRSQTGQLAVIAISDGEDMDKFNPVAAAQRMKSAYGDRVCIYAVHLGDSEAGWKLMQQVAAAGGCGYAVKGVSIASPAGMADFVEKIFLKAYVAPPMAKAEEPKVMVMPPVKEDIAEAKPQAQEAAKVEPVVITLNIEFATGKSAIKPKYHDEIKKVADYMTENPDTKAVIEGYTDNVGKAAANVKLSRARANSVKGYLVKKFGIDASRLDAAGYGPKKPIASNKTADGRQKNRRVEARIENAR